MRNSTAIAEQWLVAMVILEIKAGGNPLIEFADTYLMHEMLQESGFMREVLGERHRDFFSGRITIRKQGRVCGLNYGQQARYRVHHGHGYITQNTWKRDDHVPQIEDIQLPN